MSRFRLTSIAALALVFVLPGAALAATVDLAGTVSGPGGAGAAGVEVAVLVRGTDTIVAATTDDTGAWALQVEADPGAVLEIRATGPTKRSEPDDRGCVSLTTPTGRLEVTIEQLPVAAIEVPLDGEIVGEVCSATATPDPVEPTARPALTPPPTDLSPGGTRGGPGALLVVGLLAALSGLALALARRPRRVPRAGTPTGQ